MSEWLELAVTTSALEDVAALLTSELSWAQRGVQVADDRILFWVSASDGEAAIADTTAFLDRLTKNGFPVSALAFRDAKPESEWRDAWKRHFKTLRITRSLVIVPSWDSHEAERDDLLLHLDPGQAFGTGDHATTRMLLRAIQDMADAGADFSSFLDVGTGSGILALGASRFWPKARGVATDIDPLALTAAEENFQRNDVTNIEVTSKALEDIDGEFPLVLANIQSDVLAKMAPTLRARTEKGGHLFLSGILQGQEEAVFEAFEQAGFVQEKTSLDDRDSDWIAIQMSAN